MDNNKNTPEKDETPYPRTENEERDYDEEWADFAGLSAEMKFYMEEKQEQILKEYNVPFDELPKEIQDEIYRDENEWTATYGGSGSIARELHRSEEKEALENTKTTWLSKLQDLDKPLGIKEAKTQEERERDWEPEKD